MRQVSVKAIQCARLWKNGSKRPCPLFAPGQALSLRSYSSSKLPTNLPVVRTPMHIRRFSLALISTVVASGAWYAYQGNGSAQSLATQVRGFASNAVSYAYADSPSGPTRRPVLVNNAQFSTTAIPKDQPLSKTTDDSDRRVLNRLTPEQATEKLRKDEESYLVNRGNGVVRYDLVQVPSNSPIEDDHAELVVEVPSSAAAGEASDWNFWAVFDGHSGWTTSAKLRNVLIAYVARELNATFEAAAADPSKLVPSSEAIDAAIKQGFMRLDHEIVNESVEKVFKANSRRVAAELLAPALSGSCALLSFYNSQSKDLKVAVAGDSRAVLGRRGPNGKWTATALSEDQTGGTPSEVKRLREEHPDEPSVTRNGRILGQLEPSRSFGDAFYKWSKEVQDKIKGQFFGRTPHPLLKTPPYVTAEPVITTTKIDPSQGDFLVLATDGLWEMLSNEEVVGLVGQWLEEEKNKAAAGSNKAWLQSWFGFDNQGKLPVEEAHDASGEGQRRPIRQRQYDIAGAASRFVVEDKNAATHLVRNAMGGKDKDMVCSLLSLPSPYSRRYRDDLTVEVIFFGHGDDSRTIEVNKEASAPQEEAPQPKL
ncbi:hypothetical protein N7495_001700 [Penicillium taxi]|uniref:uncharacterized protein n=1 Tax=Penicillium taxi TaxID=168475 RepID=UPI002545A4B1|nr:uncharacterized protein N7495_001700 [Penicillium taxi]KAJ5909018.1 hypothetical protein N7495_001700 [Penicillium taxi]